MCIVISNKYRNELKTSGIKIEGVMEGEFTAEQILNAFSNYYYEKLIIDITAIKNYNIGSNLIVELRKIFAIIEIPKTILLLDNIPEINNQSFISNLNGIGVYNYTFNISEINGLLENPNNSSRIVLNAAPGPANGIIANNQSIIIGVKDATKNAGATTMVYMMYQELSKKYSVKAVEIGRTDFKYFQDDDMKSVTPETFINETLVEPYPDVILVDVNDYSNEMIIKDIIYLMEPSILKLNKAIDEDKDLLNRLKDKKVVLNRTEVPLKKIEQFENESGLKVFDIIRNLNERDAANTEVMNLLIKLGFNKINGGNIIMDDTEKKKGLFDSLN